MSLLPSKSNLRNFALAASVLAGASAFAGTSAHAGDFTPDECRIIAGVSTDVFKAIGASKLSTDFRQSIIKYVMPNGKATCDGPKDISTPTETDIATFLTIRTILLAPPREISLQKAGLRSIPNASAASRPAGDKRSDADSRPAIKLN